MERQRFPVEQLERIHVIPYVHTDYAWAHTRQWHVRRYLAAFCGVLDAMREDDRLTWCIDNLQHSWEAFVRFCPQRVAEFQQRVREGRIQVANGGVCLARPTYVGEETWVRNLVEGKRRFSRFFSLPLEEIDFFFNADTAIGHSQLPQLLSLSGHRYYRAQRPNEVMNLKGVPRQFRWRGLDGSEVAVARGEYYGFIFGDIDLNQPWEAVREAFVNTELRRQLELAHSGVMMICCGGDDTLPLCNMADKRQPLREFFAQWNARESSRILFSTPRAFFQDMLAQGVPTWEGPLDQCEMSFNPPVKGERSFWRLRRVLNDRLLDLESLSVLGAKRGGDPSQAIAGLWERLFAICGHAIEFLLRPDHEPLWQAGCAALAEAEERIRETVQDLAQQLVARGEPAYGVANPLPWDREGTVVAFHIAAAEGLGNFRLVDGRGNAVPCQVLERYDEVTRYDCAGADVLALVETPALGLVSLRAVREPGALAVPAPGSLGASHEPLILHNGALTARFQGGQLVWLEGMEMPILPLAFTETRRSPDWMHDWEPLRRETFRPERWGLVWNGPCRWVYRAEGCLGEHAATVDYILERGCGEVRLEATLDCVPGEGYFTADFAARPGPLLADIPFGAEPRELAAEPSRLRQPLADRSGGNDYVPPFEEDGSVGMEQGWPGAFYARNWAAFPGPGGDAAVMVEDCSIYYRDEREQGRISLLLHRIVDRTSKQSWNAQIDPALAGTGRHTFRYAYRPGPRDPAALARRVRELQHPLYVAPRYGQGEGLDSLRTLAVAPANVVATACYREGARTLLRVYEAAGQAVEACVVVPGYAAAELVDLLGQPTGQSLTLADGLVKFRLRPWQIATLALS